MHQLAVLCHGENELKRSTLRTLDCVGYTEGVGGRFGFVWQFNSGADATKAPQSLNTLLQAGQNFPTLPQRLKLAQSLANAILIFHGVGWLHKNFNSHSVYFFQLEKDPGGYRSRIMYEEPAIGGFDVARLHQEGEVSLRMGIDYYKLYTAPELQQKDERRFERVFDVYSLGLILFEIGTWTLVSKYAGVGKNKPPLTPQQFKERILQRCLTDLPLEMGAKYADVTVRCLNGDYPKASLDGFYMAIVQVLAECQCQGC